MQRDRKILETIKAINQINNELDDDLVEKANSDRDHGETSVLNLEDTLMPLKHDTGLSPGNSLSTGFTNLKKLNTMRNVQSEGEEEILYEVLFDKDARVAECFKSALKCWRIY